MAKNQVIKLLPNCKHITPKQINLLIIKLLQYQLAITYTQPTFGSHNINTPR